jgi:LAS superfamily LD-carboxypeptidase LdcB
MSLTTVLAGATKAYIGFTYIFNGMTWVKGNKAQRYNEKTQEMEPWSDDQYDPLKLLSKEEKAKRTLTGEQIRKVADQFGVSFEEAAEEAKQQGYQVLARPPLSSYEKH